MSKTLVEIPDLTMTRLTTLAKIRHVSRAALIRQAIELWLKAQHKSSKTDAFGILKGKIRDGVDFQRNIRSEW